jgi:alpha-L-arabinofuranosidase
MKVKTLFLSVLLASSMSAQAQVTIDIDAAQRGAQVSPELYGIFFEDINHAADGGLYAELIRNRSFEDDAKQAVEWTTIGNATMNLTTKKLLNAKQGHALAVNFKGAGDGIANEGFWGVNAVQGRTYKLTFWAYGNLKGNLTAQLISQDGKKKYAEATVEGKITGKWAKYSATMTSDGNDAKARFALVANGKGSVTLDVVSLFPPTFKNRENGCRPELAQLLYNLHPKFMRFPGGCFVEGQESPNNAFRWERTVGPIEMRPGHLNRNWNYRTSDGMGFHEFLQLAEDINAKPLYVVNIGLWHGGKTPVDSIQPWIDECMNALEYANGDITTKYGAMRAKNGHPAPFNIEYLEIGNENNQPNADQQSDHYYDRFKKFKDAVLAKYPKMHLIGNVVAWGTDDPKWESKESVELVDEHYYRSPAWFADNFHKYDTYQRGGAKVYCGEYAVTQGFGTVGNLNAGLGEAVYMMGMENNSDVVSMASYAPIFVNENDVAWQPDMIRYNSSKVMCTPSYYVQKLMAENIGTRIMQVNQTNPYKIDASAIKVKPETFQLGVGTWNTRASFQFVGFDSDKNNTTMTNMDGDNLVKPVTGEWSTNADETISQKALKESCIAIGTPKITADGYTLKLRARKDSGDEGFMVIFNYEDDKNYCWLNIGGWGNSQHAIEQVVNGSKMQTAMCEGKVEQGRWYDITLKVNGDSVKCYLDKDMIFDTKLKANTSLGVYSNATMDEAKGEMIVKVVNTSAIATTAKVNLKNFDAKSASVIRLTSANGTDENTINNPTNVYPVEETLTPSADCVIMDVPANSLNILKVEGKK